MSRLEASQSNSARPNSCARYRPSDGVLITHEGKLYPLRNQTLRVLRLLAERGDTIVSKATLHEHVWPAVVVTDDSLVQCISELRKALGDKSRTLLRTFPRQGYLLSKEAYINEVDDSITLQAISVRAFSISNLFELVPRIRYVSAVFYSVLIIGIVSTFSGERITRDTETEMEFRIASYEQGPFNYQNSVLNKVSTQIKDRKQRRSPHGGFPLVNQASDKKNTLNLNNIENGYLLLSVRTYPENGMPYWNNRFLWDGYYQEDR